MRQFQTLLLIVAGLAALALDASARSMAQVNNAPATSTAFDVASVKPNRSDAVPYSRFPLGPGDAFLANGGLFTATNQPLVAYVRFAFKFGEVDVPGLPAWAYVERFDIEARTHGSPTKDQMRLMMDSLLGDRFKLTTHIQQTPRPVFELERLRTGSLGPRLQVHDASDTTCAATAQLPQFPCGRIGPIPASKPERGRIAGRDVSMGRIAGFLTNPFTGVDRPVVDATGLAGTFDFSVEWLPPRNPLDAPDPTRDDGPTFVQALEEQLGLTLKPGNASVGVRVVDHIDRPTPN